MSREQINIAQRYRLKRGDEWCASLNPMVITKEESKARAFHGDYLHGTFVFDWPQHWDAVPVE